MDFFSMTFTSVHIISLKMFWFSIYLLQLILFNSGCAESYKDYNSKIGLNKQCGGKNLRITQLTGSLQLGESPFWDKDTRSVLFVDNFAGEVRRYDVDANRNYRAKLGKKNAGTIIPIEGSPGFFLIMYGDELCIMNWDGVSKSVDFKCFKKPEPNRPWPKFHLSDAKVAPNKALFFFNVPPFEENNGSSSMFSIADGKQKTEASNLGFGQGTGWGYGGGCFYWIDTNRYRLYKSSYNQKENKIGNTKLLLDYKKLNISGAPDSLIVDAEGAVWVACNGAYLIMKVNPNNGEVLCSIKLPAIGVSNLAIGGCKYAKKEELRCMYATTGRSNRNSTNYDGGLYRIENFGSDGVLPDKITWRTIFG